MNRPNAVPPDNSIQVETVKDHIQMGRFGMEVSTKAARKGMGDRD